MFIPESYKVEYHFDIEKKTYRQYTLTSSEKPGILPDLVRIEHNKGYNGITGADLLLRAKFGQIWGNSIIGGLRETDYPNFYYTDLPIQGVKSLLVVHISNCREFIITRVCRQFYPHGSMSFRNEIIRKIIQKF